MGFETPVALHSSAGDTSSLAGLVLRAGRRRRQGWILVKWASHHPDAAILAIAVPLLAGQLGFGLPDFGYWLARFRCELCLCSVKPQIFHAGDRAGDRWVVH